MKAEYGKTRLWMLVDQRSRARVPAVREHPQPIPEIPLLPRKLLDELRQGDEVGGSLGRTADNVVEGVGERSGLEAPVDVPTGATDIGATETSRNSKNSCNSSW